MILHDRMPVIIAPEDCDPWLNPEIEDPSEVMRPYPSDLVAFWPVSKRVGNIDDNTPELLNAIAPGA